jgi:protease IV
MGERHEEGAERRMVSVPEHLLERMIKLQESEHRSKRIRFYLLAGVILLPSVIYAVSAMTLLGSGGGNPGANYASLVKIEGPIEPEGSASALDVLPSLEAAFKDEESKGVVLLINSPGGTPVQAGVIHDRILALKRRYKKRVVAVGRDAMTSGAYMVAVAADEIYANEASVVGSIGVVIRSFGWDDLMKRYGVERRVYTAGKSKNQMDPFLPESPPDVDKTRRMLAEVHDQFISKVKSGRTGRLKAEDDYLFNGDYWTGAEALQLGLIDGVKDLPEVLEKKFGVEALKDYSRKNVFGDLARRVVGRFGAAMTGKPVIDMKSISSY